MRGELRAPVSGRVAAHRGHPFRDRADFQAGRHLRRGSVDAVAPSGFAVHLPVDGVGHLVVPVCSEKIDRGVIARRCGSIKHLGDRQPADSGGEKKTGEEVLAVVVKIGICPGVAGARSGGKVFGQFRGFHIVGDVAEGVRLTGCPRKI